MQSGFSSMTKGHVCFGADGMPDDPPKLKGAAAVPKGAAAVLKGAAAVPSPLPLAAAPPASPDIGELLGSPHVKPRPPVSPHSQHIRANFPTDMYVFLKTNPSLTRMCACGAFDSYTTHRQVMNMAEQQEKSSCANKHMQMSTDYCTC